MLTLTCQRWRDRRSSAVPAGPLIDPSIMAVAAIEERVAKAFVVQHHYSGTFPAARLSVGLFRRADLVGVAVFSVPMNNRAVPAHTGLEAAAGAELGRLVLLDDVPGNAESWFMSRAFDVLRQEKRQLEAVLSYADPATWQDATGRLVKPGHVGTVYQALSAAYRGRTSPRTGYQTREGRIISGRALSKLRLGERGWRYALETLGRAGLPLRSPAETGREYVERLVADRHLVRFTHPGNHAYAFPLTRRARVAGAELARLPYPKANAL
jgi:hypothetical protein